MQSDKNIQGNVLAPFNKDHQVFLLLRFPDGGTGPARGWLDKLIPHVSTNDQVAAFNKEFSRARRASGSEPADLFGQWLNVSFTGDGLGVLAAEAHAALAALPDIDAGVASWLTGAVAAASSVGDTAASAPEHWLFGSVEQPVHAIVAVAADRPEDLHVAVEAQRELAARHGLTVVFEQDGETLPRTARGHEHFGFKDGVSQPGVTGFDEASGEKGREDQVKDKPGTDLIAPGEFVLGYPRQGDSERGRAVPRWMWDGSFLVLRRLAQDVPGFWADLERAFDSLEDASTSGESGFAHAETLAARLVGRWRNGTPTDQCPVSDVPLPTDPGLNDFDFDDDLDGIKTPHAAHIRKVYPRKGAQPNVTEADAEQRRILRRGIPFGETFEPAAGHGHGVDAYRGLVFQCYQSSLIDQFMFIQQSWVNNDDFSSGAAGKDAVIGLASIVTVKPNGVAKPLDLRQWVSTQGSVFAFTPSLPTLRHLADGQQLTIA